MSNNMKRVKVRRVRKVKEEFLRIRVTARFKECFFALAELKDSSESQIARDALNEYLVNHGINLEEVHAEMQKRLEVSGGS